METTGDRIKKKRNDLGLTLVEVAEKVGVRDATIQRYESGEIKNIKQPILIKIAKVLNVSVGYLLGYETEDAHKIAEAMKNHDARELEKLMGFPEGTIGSFIKKGPSKPNCNNLNDKTNIPQLMELVNHFNQLNKKGQIKAIENVVDLTKIQEYRKENSLESKTIDFEKEKQKRELPYYTIGASAGNGNFLATNDYILIEADEYVPQEANYALCVKGDSMEPKYKNGQMIYVKTQKSVENGEIGIFCLNNDVYVKKFECENGKCMLISLNPAYDPIKINDSDEIMCFGKVLN